MASIVEYSKGTDRIEKREELIFTLVDELDKESYNLFCDITNLNEDSLYKIDFYKERLSKLSILFDEALESFNYLKEIETSSHFYADRRYWFKFFLSVTTAINVISVRYSMMSVLLGVLTFSVLSLKNNKDSAEEYAEIYANDKLYKDDERRLGTTKKTLENCVRLLNGKIDIMNDSFFSDNANPEKFVVKVANFLIGSYIGKTIDKQNIDSLDDGMKGLIVEILKRDLNSESNDIFELLEASKNQNVDSFKMIKKYIN